MSESTSNPSIALVSMPWSLFNRPSVQLGTLKAYLEKNGVAADCFHPYLNAAQAIGTETYTYLCKNSWAGEALYAAMLFPQRWQRIEGLFRLSCEDAPEIADRFGSLQHLLEKALHEWLSATDFSRYGLIGFSVCFSQLFSSLTAAAAIKSSIPNSFIVLGGSSCVGNMGHSLLNFSQIDHVIEGEGEEQLLALWRSRSGRSAAAISATILQRTKENEISDLDQLPTPDYHPYFSQLERIFPGRPFNPTLPLEFSRGCWWRKCTFCNLNLQWRGYRRKTAAKMIGEVQQLHRQHDCLDFTFCDNALPLKETDHFFSAMRKLDIDLSFFAEIRAAFDPPKLSLYRGGGLHSVQVGIEALSTSLLNKMKKGVSVIENLAVMKHCAENSIRLDGNLIVDFPGSTEQEILETLRNLDYALPFHPLSAASFFLGSGSAIDRDPSHFGIQAITRHPNYNVLLPRELRERMDLLIKDYRGDKTVQRKRWQPVRDKMQKWQNFHKNRSKSDAFPLSYRDGGSFLLIRQERLEGTPLLHRLRGASRRLYLYCSVIRSLEDVMNHFQDIPEKSILNFFDDLSRKQLLYEENRQYLALAIRVR